MSRIAVEERVDRLEAAMSHLADTVEHTWREMLDIERRAEKDRQQVVKLIEQAEKERKDFNKQMALLPEYFPEYAGKVLCPAVASVYLDPSLIAFLNHEKLYGIAMGDETMQVVNPGRF